MTMLKNRLDAIHKQLMAIHEGSSVMTTPALGREREEFVDIFLRNCIPQGFRFGTGQAIDGTGASSRQLDIVIDSTFAPSIPLLGSSTVRLFPIESISSVIEVKSNLVGKWNEVIVNCNSVTNLTIGERSGMGMDEPRLRSENVAYFAVGYTGWETDATLIEKWTNSNVDCVLQLKPLKIIHKNNETHEIIDGPLALFRFLELLVISVKRNESKFDMSEYY